MIASSFDFWHYVVLFILGLIVLFGFRLAIFLGNLSERFVMVVAQMGLHAFARMLLSLVGYSRATYLQSRLLYSSRVNVRYMIFWGALLLWAGFLWVLREGNTISAIRPYWALGLVLYVVFRLLMSLREDDKESDIASEGGSESKANMRHSSPSVIRRWDYLDEIFNS